MPTTRPRHVITETDPITEALAVAARRWPADADSQHKLLLRLVEEGRRSLASGEDISRRQDAVARTRGLLEGVYGENYLSELRQDWPE